MELQQMERGEVVFEVDSQGDRFYFIIEGAVEILIPDDAN